MNPDEPLIFQQPVTLEHLRFGAQVQVPAYMMQTGRLTADYRPDLDRIVYRLTAQILARKLVEETQIAELQVPSSWWQRCKHESWLGRHRPAWMRRRWPVRWTVMRQPVTFTRYATFPDAGITPPQLGAPVIYETVQQMPWVAERATPEGGDP